MPVAFLKNALGAALMAAHVAAHALAPPLPVLKTGFILHSPDSDILHLPANARGVLFQADLAEETYFQYVVPGEGMVLAAPPPPLRAEQFSIVGPDGKHLPAVITRLDVDAAMGTARPYFVPRRPTACRGKTSRCIRGSGRQARTPSPKEGLRDGTLIDATEQVKRGVGLFRIAPREGLAPGTYTFAYRHEGGDDIPLIYPVAARIHVDKAAVPADSVPVLLRPVGSPQPLFHKDGMGEYAVLRRTFRYTPPARYGPYAALLTYATRARATSGEGYCDEDCERQLEPDYQDTQDMARLDTRCGTTDTPALTFQVSGFAGLLELEDRLHPAPVLAVPVGGKGMRCEGVELLKGALAARNTAAIRAIACQVQGMPHANIADREAMMAMLRPLATSADGATRRCAWSALVAVAFDERDPRAARLLRPATAQPIVTLLGQALRRNDVADREHAVYVLHALWRGLRSDQDPENAVFARAVPGLIERAADPRTDRNARGKAIQTLGVLGRQALPALGVLGRIAAQDKDSLLRMDADAALGQIRTAK